MGAELSGTIDILSWKGGVAASRPSEMCVPLLASASACWRFSGVMRLSAPRSSALPHRPQFDSSFHSCSYRARGIGGWGAAGASCCVYPLEPGADTRTAIVAARTRTRTMIHLLLTGSDLHEIVRRG